VKLNSFGIFTVIRYYLSKKKFSSFFQILDILKCPKFEKHSKEFFFTCFAVFAVLDDFSTKLIFLKSLFF